jgi:hypothetical protein
MDPGRVEVSGNTQRIAGAREEAAAATLIAPNSVRIVVISLMYFFVIRFAIKHPAALSMG